MLEPTTHQPEVSIQIQLYRDGKQVLSSPPMNVGVKNQTDLSRLVTTGVLRLNPDLEPGPYFLQLIATDLVSKNKTKSVQWIDFEIVR